MCGVSHLVMCWVLDDFHRISDNINGYITTEAWTNQAILGKSVDFEYMTNSTTPSLNFPCAQCSVISQEFLIVCVIIPSPFRVCGFHSSSRGYGQCLPTALTNFHFADRGLQTVETLYGPVYDQGSNGSIFRLSWRTFGSAVDTSKHAERLAFAHLFFHMNPFFPVVFKTQTWKQSYHRQDLRTAPHSQHARFDVSTISIFFLNICQTVKNHQDCTEQNERAVMFTMNTDVFDLFAHVRNQFGDRKTKSPRPPRLKWSGPHFPIFSWVLCFFTNHMCPQSDWSVPSVLVTAENRQQYGGRGPAFAASEPLKMLTIADAYYCCFPHWKFRKTNILVSHVHTFFATQWCALKISFHVPMQLLRSAILSTPLQHSHSYLNKFHININQTFNLPKDSSGEMMNLWCLWEYSDKASDRSTPIARNCQFWGRLGFMCAAESACKRDAAMWPTQNLRSGAGRVRSFSGANETNVRMCLRTFSWCDLQKPRKNKLAMTIVLNILKNMIISCRGRWNTWEFELNVGIRQVLSLLVRARFLFLRN